MKTIKNFIAAILCISMLAACGKDGDGTGRSSMRVKMKDAPGDFQKVNVEIISVQVHHTDENNPGGSWTTLATNAAVYDLLLLQDSITAVLANNTQIPSGGVDQLRLILGANNSVMVDGIVFPLKTPSAMQSGLKINMNTFLEDGETYEVLIDFDANASIVVEGNGSFSLKPVIKVESIIEL